MLKPDYTKPAVLAQKRNSAIWCTKKKIATIQTCYEKVYLDQKNDRKENPSFQQSYRCHSDNHSRNCEKTRIRAIKK